MHVLMLLNSLAPGGTERSTIILASHLRKLGVTTTIVTLSDAPHTIEGEAIAAGVTVRRLRPGSFAKQVVELRCLMKNVRPDVLHTALFEADITGRCASWRTGYPVVSSFVNTPYDRARLSDPNVSRWKLAFVRAVDSLSAHLFVDAFHAVSDGTARANAQALAIPLDRVIVAERGRDPGAVGMTQAEARQTLREEVQVQPEQRIVLNLGRQEHQKAQVDLVNALPLLVDEGVDAVVLIAGRPGNATSAIEEATRRLGVHQSRVRLLGHRSDVPRLLAAADVLVISSLFEGTAGVALEAMSGGTPIVSTRVSGMEGVLIHRENALLVPPNDPVSLAQAVADVLADPELATRLASRGREAWQSRFTVQAAAERMLQLYEALT